MGKVSLDAIDEAGLIGAARRAIIALRHVQGDGYDEGEVIAEVRCELAAALDRVASMQGAEETT